MKIKKFIIEQKNSAKDHQLLILSTLKLCLLRSISNFYSTRFYKELITPIKLKLFPSKCHEVGTKNLANFPFGHSATKHPTPKSNAIASSLV